MQYKIERSKWNPLRYILGKYTVTHNAKKAWRQLVWDRDDINISTQRKDPVTEAILKREVVNFLNTKAVKDKLWN